MLAVTLQTGQAIEIGPDIKVKIIFVRAAGGEVRLGVEAPRELKIWRYDERPAPSLAAAGSPAAAPVCLKPGLVAGTSPRQQLAPKDVDPAQYAARIDRKADYDRTHGIKTDEHVAEGGHVANINEVLGLSRHEFKGRRRRHGKKARFTGPVIRDKTLHRPES